MRGTGYRRRRSRAAGDAEQTACLGQTQLPHELLHYLLYRWTGSSDSLHTDPRWTQQLPTLEASLATCP